MPRMTITIDDTVDDLTAAWAVTNVIKQGRISENKNGRCYCFVTIFKNDVKVYADRTKSGTDTFKVMK